jgi:hypothetical protein
MLQNSAAEGNYFHSEAMQMLTVSWRILLISAFLLALVEVSPISTLAAPAQRENTIQQQSSSPNGRAKQTFSGKVIRSGQKFVLYEKASGTSYNLDDQQWAKLFQDQDVRVTGSLDARSNMILVFSMEAPKSNRSS